MVVAPAITDSVGTPTPAFAGIRDGGFSTADISGRIGYRGESLAVRSNDRTQIRFVAILLALRNPSAIARLVIAMVVDAINRQIAGIAVGYCPIAKRLKPLPVRTNQDSTAAIPTEGMMSRIPASLTHRIPCLEKARSGLSMCPQMADLSAEAAAGFDVASPERLSIHDLFVAAVAPAKPSSPLVVAPGGFYHRQTSENLPGDIDRSGHASLRERFACQATEPAISSPSAPLRILGRIPADG